MNVNPNLLKLKLWSESDIWKTGRYLKNPNKAIDVETHVQNVGTGIPSIFRGGPEPLGTEKYSFFYELVKSGLNSYFAIRQNW